MVAKSHVRLGIVLTLAFALLGIKVSETCKLKNSTGASVRIELTGPSAKQDLGILKSGQSIQIQDWLWHEVVVHRGDGVLHFRTASPPPECVSSSGWFKSKRLFKAEISPNGTIQLLCATPSNSFPISPQPQ